MTILEELATLASSTLASRVARHREFRTGAGEPKGAKFDNRPTWDNWAKKASPFKKKTHYFGNKKGK